MKVNMTVSLDAEVVQAVERSAGLVGSSRSHFINEALKAFYKDKEKHEKAPRKARPPK